MTDFCPNFPHPLQVGSGLQIFLSSSLTLILGALGFLSPAVRGAMLSTLLGMYMLLSMVAGFAAVYLHGVITRSHWAWRGVALRTTAAVPTVLALVFLFLNLIIKHTGSVGAIPFGALLTFVATWLLVCFPLGYLGGFLATRTPLIEFPTRLGAVPREVRPRHRGWPARNAVRLLEECPYQPSSEYKPGALRVPHVEIRQYTPSEVFSTLDVAAVAAV